VVDFLPTIASLAGISQCEVEWDGLDLSQYFQSDSQNEERMLLIDCDIGCNITQEFGEDDEDWMKQPKAAIRYMNYKLMSQCVTVEDGLVVSSNKTYFFDVVHDVQESHNYAEFIDPYDTDFPYYKVYWFMMDALKAYALEAHHQFPADEPQIWCENCTNLCGDEEVNGLASRRPWSWCSNEMGDWNCSSYCRSDGEVFPRSNNTSRQNICTMAQDLTISQYRDIGVPSALLITFSGICAVSLLCLCYFTAKQRGKWGYTRIKKSSTRPMSIASLDIFSTTKSLNDDKSAQGNEISIPNSVAIDEKDLHVY